MKIAIMGAGMSGLACARVLERNGVKPDIFEKRNCVGDRFVNAEATFSILNRPVKDGLKFISNKFGIELKPVSKIEKLVIHSKNETGTVSGVIGYTNIRGRHDDAYEVQISKDLKSKIHFNSKYEYEDLCRKYEYVVLATGDGAYACHLGNYRSDLTCTIRGATIEGEFVTSMPHVWFNYDIIPKGYAFLIPYSSTEANLSIAYPDYPDNIKLNIDYMWDRLFSLVSRDMDQKFVITDKFEISRYMMGICGRPKIDNTYYIGNCFGTLSPGLGFGQFASVLTGAYAAFDMLGIGEYEELVIPLYENYEHSLVLRRFLEKLDDSNFDKVVRNLDNILIDKIIDKIFNTDSGIELLRDMTPLLRLQNYFNSKI